MEFLRNTITEIKKPEVEKVDSNQEEEIMAVMDEFSRLVGVDEINKEHQISYSEDPGSFFLENNFNILKGYTAGKRLALLAKLSSRLDVTPLVVEKYFNEFPEDVCIAGKIIKDFTGKGKYPRWDFYTLLATSLNQHIENFKEAFKDSERALEIASRRNLAVQNLMNRGQCYSEEAYEHFGEAGRNILNLTESAIAATYDEKLLDVENVFDEKFDSLPEYDRCILLYMLIADVQNEMVREEIFNTNFTSESVLQSEESTIERIANDKEDTPVNPMHSMIFKSHQPPHVYNQGEEFFDKISRPPSDSGEQVELYPFHQIALAALPKFANLSHYTEEAVSLLVEFWNKNKNPIFYDAIRKSLLKLDVSLAAEKIFDILIHNNDSNDVNSVAVLLADLIKNEESKKKFENAFSQWGKVKNGASLLGFMLYSAKHEGLEFNYKEIVNLDLNIKDFGIELSEEEKQGMFVVAERNWNQDPSLKDEVLEGLGVSLQNTTNQKYYVLKFQGKIVAFMRFEKTNRGSLYAGSFNVDPEARGLGIGDEMMARALKKESEENVIEATVSPRIPAGTAYVERVGFVIDGIISDYHQTKEPLFTITLDKNQNEKYVYRNEGKSNEIAEDDLKKQCASIEMLDQIIGAESIVLKFEMKTEFEKMKETMNRLLVAKSDDGVSVVDGQGENKYKITRYFQDDKDDNENNVRYFVFEKI